MRSSKRRIEEKENEKDEEDVHVEKQKVLWKKKRSVFPRLSKYIIIKILFRIVRCRPQQNDLHAIESVVVYKRRNGIVTPRSTNFCIYSVV